MFPIRFVLLLLFLLLFLLFSFVVALSECFGVFDFVVVFLELWVEFFICCVIRFVLALSDFRFSVDRFAVACVNLCCTEGPSYYTDAWSYCILHS